MYRYEMIIYWSHDDQAYVAEAPELPGCMAHGDTYAIAVANMQEAIRLWIDMAKEFGDPIPTAKERWLVFA